MRLLLLPIRTVAFIPWIIATPFVRDQAVLKLGLIRPHRPHILEHEDEPVQEDKAQLLNRYAPILKLSSEERYFPSAIDYALPHFTFSEEDDGSRSPVNKTLLTPPLLDRLPYLGQGKFLSIPQSHNPQPSLDHDAGYLYGPSGQPGGMKQRDGRGWVEEPVYGFWVDQGRKIVDLWYWTYYAFNYGKPVGGFGLLGHHVGDWEYMRVRTVNGSAVSVDYHSHNGGAFSSGTRRWDDVPKIDSRPVAFCAAGSHGLWPSPGDHILAKVLNVFYLIDSTDDHGAIWDTKNRVVPNQYWYGESDRRKVWHRGNDSWLNFRGRWGNRGQQDCWWHKLVGICQLVDAPPGPNRWFGSPPDCTTAPLVGDTSSYSFYLSAPAVQWAEEKSISIVQVEQVCARPKRRDEDGDDDNGLDGRSADYTHDDTREEDLDIWTVSGMTEYAGRAQHSVTTLPCSGVGSVVKAYHISLCLGDGKCITTSRDRKICSFEQGKKGYHFGRAVRVDDIDDWRWNF